MTDFETQSKTVTHIDSFPIKHWELDNVGNLRFVAPIARTGDLVYYTKDGREQPEFVPEKTLIESLDSFKTKAITLRHPSEKVTPQNSMKYQRGLTGYTGFFDGKFLWLTGTATDQKLIDSIVKKATPEISPGYDALVKQDSASTRLVQAIRRGNHLAAVPRGRNGRGVAFKIDSEQEGDEGDSVDALVLKEEFSFEDLGNAPEELYQYYRDETKSQLFFSSTKQQKSKLNTRQLILQGLV